MEINRPKKGRKYVYVLDFEDGRVYRYDVWLNDSEEIEDYLTFWPHTLNRHEQNKIRQEIINGSAKHTVFPNEEYQRKSTTYFTNRALTVESNKIPKIIFEKITFYRNHYEMTFNYSFDENYQINFTKKIRDRFSKTSTTETYLILLYGRK